MLNKLMKELNSLLLAKDLLYEVWIELSPYSNDISSKLLRKLNDYFEFDDSE